MRVSLFIPCFNDALFPETGRALVRILERLGHEVDFPPNQTCCGQVHFNTGYGREAARLMKRHLRIFGEAGVVVAPSASCVAMVREQYPLLAERVGGSAAREEAEALARRTFEMSEFLVGELGVEDVGAVFPGRVAFHPTCHSMRSIDVGDAPLRLLKAVEGLELVKFQGTEECCGFGGTFSVKNPDTSLAMLQDKIRAVEESGARYLTAVDNSCLMHLAGGLRRQVAEPGPGSGGSTERREPPLTVLHLAEILASRNGAPGWEPSP